MTPGSSANRKLSERPARSPQVAKNRHLTQNPSLSEMACYRQFAQSFPIVKRIMMLNPRLPRDNQQHENSNCVAPCVPVLGCDGTPVPCISVPLLRCVQGNGSLGRWAHQRPMTKVTSNP
jgi:hypothetical protein